MTKEKYPLKIPIWELYMTTHLIILFKSTYMKLKTSEKSWTMVPKIHPRKRKEKKRIQSKKRNTIVRLVCVSDKNTWKYQHCLLLTRLLDSLTFPLLIWKMGKEKTTNPLMFPLKDGGFLHSYYNMEKGSYFKAAICKIIGYTITIMVLSWRVFCSCKNHVSSWALEWTWCVSINVLWEGNSKLRTSCGLREERWGNSWEQWNFKGSNLPFCKECRSLLCIHCWSDHILCNRFGFVQTPQSTNLNTFSLSIPWQRVKWCTSSSSLSLCKFLQKWDEANSSTQRSLPITPLRISITAFTNKI